MALRRGMIKPVQWLGVKGLDVLSPIIILDKVSQQTPNFKCVQLCTFYESYHGRYIIRDIFTVDDNKITKDTIVVTI